MDAVSIADLAGIVGGRVTGSTPQADVIRHVTIHSQHIMQGSVFFALPGARTDGHRFARDALANGALTNATAQDVRQGARDPQSETGAKITAPFTVAAVGDIIMPQPLDRIAPGFAALIERMKKADVAFANMESSLVDLRHLLGQLEDARGRQIELLRQRRLLLVQVAEF